MRSVFFFTLAAVIVVGLSGCASDRAWPRHGNPFIDGSCGHCDDCPEACQSCDCEAGCCEPDCQPRCRPVVDPGPPSAAITYPYYTTRGPRDFLARNPRSIGP